MHHRIGLVYVAGALPCFEEFGGLPTDLVREDALVDGKPASDILDLIIIPGGSLIESKSITPKLGQEIIRMADSGKFVLGICSGFQVLAKRTDIGRLSSIPILREGLGLLDVEFEPLICTDRVTSTIVGKSFLTENIGERVTGFHCHTYGKIIHHKNAQPILVSNVQRQNYLKNQQKIVSGFSNIKGNVVGMLGHALLDENPNIIDRVMKSLDVSPEELEEIRAVNSSLSRKMKSELGISTNVQIENISSQRGAPKVLLFTAATGSGSGKTFITTGISGALKKRGIRFGLLKIGGDIRDIVPALYLIKEPIRKYSSIKISGLGWMNLDKSLEYASHDYDFVLIEGAMSSFTGCLTENVKRPASTAEIAVALGAPTIVVVACNTMGIEDALVSGINHVKTLKKFGVNVVGVILNKAHTSSLTEEQREYIKSAFGKLGVSLLGILPHLKMEGRGAMPEVEIKYEDFGAKATETIETFLNLDELEKQASVPSLNSQLDFGELLQKFKRLILEDSKFDRVNKQA